MAMNRELIGRSYSPSTYEVEEEATDIFDSGEGCEMRKRLDA